MHHSQKADSQASRRFDPKTKATSLCKQQPVHADAENATPADSVNHKDEALFDSIESAQEYLRLLMEVIGDARQDLEDVITNQDERSVFARWRDAVQLASYNLEKLHIHLKSSTRILNDLRSIRRLLFAERQGTLSP